MLERRDMPPLLTDSAAENEPKTPTKSRRRRPKETDELPFPRTCGTCWSPQGDLLYFSSLQNVIIPFPRRWSFTDYGRLLKIHREKDLLTFFDDEDADKHSEVASKMRVDPTVHIVPSSRLCGLVEDNWWTSSLASFNFEPLPSERLGEICRYNAESAISLCRDDLAEVWNLLAFFLEDLPDLARDTMDAGGGGSISTFVAQLLQQVIRQLFEAQETLTLAMVGVVLVRASSFHERAGHGLEDNLQSPDAEPLDEIPQASVISTSQNYAAYASQSWSPHMDKAFPGIAGVSKFKARDGRSLSGWETTITEPPVDGGRFLTRKVSNQSPDSTISEPPAALRPSNLVAWLLPIDFSKNMS
jgi:hypothetical protein